MAADILTKEVPGTAALDKGGWASLTALSCPSAGNCAGGGYYKATSSYGEAFVVTEKNGVWGKAQEVPGLPALNKGIGGLTDAYLEHVSCPSAGNCTAAGYYMDAKGNLRVFVISQAGGLWGMAQEAPGFSALSKASWAAVETVSCATPGNCSVGGYYSDTPNTDQAFVVNQVRGRWQRTEEVPGTARLNTDGAADTDTISCTTPGNCTAVGTYEVIGSGDVLAFAAAEVRGRWGQAHTLRLLEPSGGSVPALWCARPGDCVAGGIADGPGASLQAVVIKETRGRWGQARLLPGTGVLNKDGQAAVSDLSCTSPGNCGAGGYYQDASRAYDAFAASERNGVWSKAIQVPGTSTLDRGGKAGLQWVSCHNQRCDAGGYYTDSSGNQQVFVVG